MPSISMKGEKLEEGINVEKYANPEFSYLQMIEIQKELKNEKQKEPELEM